MELGENASFYQMKKVRKMYDASFNPQESLVLIT